MTVHNGGTQQLEEKITFQLCMRGAKSGRDWTSKRKRAPSAATWEPKAMETLMEALI